MRRPTSNNFAFPRVQALPEVGRASLRIDGVERVGYEFAEGGTRPFFYPLIGPAGRPLTRMGHPNPVGHEHHKSIWFGHQSVNGVNFWEDRPDRDVRVRHKRVLAYRDGPDWAGMVVELDWWANGRALMTQRLTVAIEPRETTGGFVLDLDSRFEAAAGPVELGKTNFGFLGVRVAKTMSERFGGGRLLDAEGRVGEPAIFGKRSRWVDDSGPVAHERVEGIAYFDHPSNPGHPTHWHVRADGWFEAAFNLAEPWGVASGHPLDLRNRLLVHDGPADPEALDREWTAYAATSPRQVEILR